MISKLWSVIDSVDPGNDNTGMATLLSGPSHPPAAGGPPGQLVVLLHGYGADGNDLIGLAPAFAQALPHAEFVSPNAPERCAIGFGYQWFGLTNLDPTLVKAGVAKSAAMLDAFIEDALKARGLDETQLALIGFSQGTMMSLDRALRVGGAAAVVGFSGMVADPTPRLPPDAKRPPVLLVHGTADTMVPFIRLAEAEDALKAADFPVESFIRPGLGHGIDPEGARRAAAFLAQNLANTGAP
jgi:phospholipase/carboxylesterase